MDWSLAAPWTAAYWLCAAGVLLMSALLTLQAWEHRRFVRSRVAHPEKLTHPGRVLLCVPCKGSEPGLETNLRPLFEQDHPDYCLRLVVESRDDGACPTIARLLAAYPCCRAEMIVAGACTTGGQKVHNLLAVTAELPAEATMIAFADSDVRPPRDWLRRLTQHLHNRGAATGYRCYIPRRNTPANCLLASINAATTGMMFPGRHHLVWGGSWAIRRDVFETGRLRDAWQGTLSDDMIAARVLVRQSQRVSFEPACVVASSLDVDWRGMAEFLRRQLTIGRCCAPWTWAGAILLNTATQAIFWGGLVAAIVGLRSGASWTWQPATVAGLLYALGIARAWFRQTASRSYLPDHQLALAAARRTDLWGGPVVGLVLWLGLVSSAIGRRITWRGITYEMDLGGQARRIGGPQLPPAREQHSLPPARQAA